MSQNKIFYLTSSPLTAPTTQFPAYVLNGNTVTIYPSTILEATSIQSQYIRYPLTPKWTYSQLTGGQPEFNPAQADYQDFELPLSDEPTLVAKICSYIGIEIRESDVYDFGQQELRDETQQTS